MKTLVQRLNIFLVILITLVSLSCKKDSSTQATDDQLPVYESSGVIDAKGGIIQISSPDSQLNGVSIKIPSGALSNATNISINSVSQTFIFEGDTAKKIVKLEPSGLLFTKPVSVGIPYGIEANPESLKIFYYNEATFSWVSLPTETIDYSKKIIYSQTNHFSIFTVKKSKIKFDINLYKSNNKIAAHIKLLTPLSNMSASWFSQYSNMRQLLFSNASYVLAYYKVTLREKVDFWFDKDLETKVVVYGISLDRSNTYEVRVKNGMGNILLETNEKYLLPDDVEKYYSGEPVLFSFKSVQPSNNKEYYVEVKLYYVDSYGWVENSGGLWGTKGYYISTYDEATAFNDMIQAPDDDGDDVINSFDGASPPVPTLSSPTNGATNQATSPTFSWNASSGATSYTLQVSTNSSFSSFVYNQSVLTGTNQQVSGLSNSTTYYWRINATNSYGTSGWSSPVWNFTTTSAPVAPTVTTASITNITTNSATSGGEVTSQGSTSVTARGVCWSTTENPTIADIKTSDGTGTGSFTSSITGLNASTTYYVRAYATNSAGTSYGDQVSFTTTSSGTLPTVTTASITNITTNSASGGGNVTSAGSSSVASRGVCWSTSQNPTIAGSKTVDGSGTGSFTSSITGLNASTTYYVRAYATNSAGTSYGSQVSFTTNGGPTGIPCPGMPTVTYLDKTYNTVQIGNQCWLKENLDVGTRIDGSQNQTNNSTIEKYCYGDNTANCNTYGGLYQWNEAMQYSTTPGVRGICPSGWHIPTSAEFETLRTTVGGNGNALKEIGQGDGAGAGTNTSGFSALLAGWREDGGPFYYLGARAYFWRSTETSANYVENIYLYILNSIIYSNSTPKKYGFSIRCVKD